MFLSSLKRYSLAIAGGVLGVLVFAVRVLMSENSRLRRKAETSEARIEHAKAVMREDAAIEEQADTHLAEVVREIEENGHTDELLDPNDWIWEDDEGER